MPDQSHYRVGVDIGGTFTDFVVYDAGKDTVEYHKVPTTSEKPWKAVIEGLQQLAARNVLDPAKIEYFSHGTTLAINTLIEQDGAKTGLLITEGFEDILEIQRLRLAEPLDFFNEKLPSLVDRRFVKGVNERIGAHGEIYDPLDSDEVLKDVQDLVNHGCENNIHERSCLDAIKEAFPDLYISTSSDIWPQEREYERALITVINAYIGDRMDEYFSQLTTKLAAINVEATVLSTKSNGGVMTAASAGERPVETLFSGPAAGVMGARWAAKASGFNQLITFDMGGTSADVSVVDDEPRFSTDASAGGYNVMMPSIDITAIGAGGGSIAWVDEQGVLKVGPESAGSNPGPACYGRGGTDPTITDAYVVLNLLNPERFSGGELRIDTERTEAAIADLAQTLELSPEDVAASILDVATAKMTSELVPLLARRGVEVTDFTMVAYGGAGPTHSFFLSEEIGIQKLVIPESPGTMSAMGSIIADCRADFVRSYRVKLGEITVSDLRDQYEALEQEALEWLRDEDLSLTSQRTIREVEMRFQGQSYEVSTPVPTKLDTLDQVREAFHRAYEEVYNFVDPNEDVEITDIRVQIVGETPTPELRAPSSKQRDGNEPQSTSADRSVYLAGRWREVPVYKRCVLQAGDQFEGPAIVDQDDTTVVVPGGFSVTVDSIGNLIGRRNTA